MPCNVERNRKSNIVARCVCIAFKHGLHVCAGNTKLKSLAHIPLEQWHHRSELLGIVCGTREGTVASIKRPLSFCPTD
jgi:hypothetical protein